MGWCACAGCLPSMAAARVLPTDLQPLIEPNYEPRDADERGIWQSLERVEEAVRNSPQRLVAPDLENYTRGVVERLIGRPAPEVRIYLVRNAFFNASMAPNGMMVVHSGLMARMRNEAQFAAVLGHESGHYFRKHTIVQYRTQRRRAAIGAFVAAAANVAAGASAQAGSAASGRSWIDAANAINSALMMSLFQFSRDEEAEADAYGIGLMAHAGYAPEAASQVWGQFIAERKASAASLHKRYHDESDSSVSTHPPNQERMDDLAETAMILAHGREDTGFERRDEWRAATLKYLPMLLEEQIRLNDPGASL